MPTRLTTAAAVGSIAALLLGTAPVGAHADEQANRASVATAAGYIADAWKGAGNPSDSLIALAAADAQPAAVQTMSAALTTGATGWATNPASRGKIMIAADAANLDARFFADQTCKANWAEVLRSEADTAQLKFYWAPQLTVIALARLGEPAPDRALEAILSGQAANGAWGYGSGAGFTAQPDDTAMSIYALSLVAGSDVEAAETRAAARAALDKAVAWSRSDEARKELDGNYYWATYSAMNSTGLMASALAEAGEDVTSPQAFLVAKQLPASGWSNTLNGTNVNLMATQQAILGVAGAGYATARATGTVTHTCAQPPAFSAQPQDVAAPPSRAAISATVPGAEHLQWQRFSGTAWADVDGATSATLTTTVEGQYRLTATNAHGSSFSRVAALTLTAEPTPTPTPTPTRTTSPTPTATPTKRPSVRPTTPGAFDLYTTPGVHTINGRTWATVCEPYSQTKRCRTEIWATTVVKVKGSYVRTTGWAFNNQTYAASPRSLWAGNPLAKTGKWTAKDGRAWRTDCDSAATGKGGCRNYALATVVAAVALPTGGYTFRQDNLWLLNSMVRFS